jgi:hypothetical protein
MAGFMAGFWQGSGRVHGRVHGRVLAGFMAGFMAGLTQNEDSVVVAGLCCVGQCSVGVHCADRTGHFHRTDPMSDLQQYTLRGWRCEVMQGT